MYIDAFCDECFTPVSREHAEARRPCPKCGNALYEVLNIDKPMPSGNYAFFSQRRERLDMYYDALSQMEAIRVTGITDADYKTFIEAGELCISVFDDAMAESFESDMRAGLEPELPPVIPFVTRLPDMYMRRGHWTEAVAAYAKCSVSRFLTEFDFDRLINDASENRLCVLAISDLIEDGEHSQKAIKKALKDHSTRALNWALQYYHGFTRAKAGSDYFVDFAEFSQTI